jgi:hypothetical protein
MKIFISHQKQDSQLATAISMRLQVRHRLECYLDVVDPYAAQTGDDLGDYLRRTLGTCTQLMAVVSNHTRTSWWVPWEIGVATEKDFPIATYAGDDCELPSYLKKWPYLQTQQDLDIYAAESKQADHSFRVNKGALGEAVARARSTRAFHRSLRGALGQ